jgi:transposase
MRVTTLFRRLLGVTGLRVTGALFTTNGSLSVEVAPSWKRPRCSGCGKVAPGYDRRPLRWWRHMAFGRTLVRLSYAPRRVHCAGCGIRSEQLPWAEAQSRFTWQFEELVAYLAQITDLTHVGRLTTIAWATVVSIVERVVARKLEPQRLVGLHRLGVDEFSFRKRHRYLTVVVDHDRRRIVWAAEGRSAETLQAFFTQLGPEACAAITLVTIDMSGSYQKAVRECLPNAQIVFDRFHVQQLATDALDEVRRSLVRELEDREQASAIKNTRWALLKRPEDLTVDDRECLSGVQQSNRPLYRAYLLKETLSQALDYRQPKRARRALEGWMAWASRSRLKPFQKVARTLREHLPGILAYIKHRLTNGLVEGLNNKLRLVSRRAYGFHSAEALIAMLYLNCAGIPLDPPLPSPTPC